LSHLIIGKNPEAKIILAGRDAAALEAVLENLTGKEADFMERPVSEEECKTWASVLKANLPKLKLLRGTDGRGHKNSFLVVQGTDIKQQFITGHYKHQAIDFEPRWELAQNLDHEWNLVVNSFIRFMNTCGGIEEVTQ